MWEGTKEQQEDDLAAKLAGNENVAIAAFTISQFQDLGPP